MPQGDVITGAAPLAPHPAFLAQGASAAAERSKGSEELEAVTARLPAGAFAGLQESGVQQTLDSLQYNAKQGVPEVAAGPFATLQDLSIFTGVDPTLDAEDDKARRASVALDRRTESQAVIVEDLQAGKVQEAQPRTSRSRRRRVTSAGASPALAGLESGPEAGGLGSVEETAVAPQVDDVSAHSGQDMSASEVEGPLASTGTTPENPTLLVPAVGGGLAGLGLGAAAIGAVPRHHADEVAQTEPETNATAPSALAGQPLLAPGTVVAVEEWATPQDKEGLAALPESLEAPETSTIEESGEAIESLQGEVPARSPPSWDFGDLRAAKTSTAQGDGFTNAVPAIAIPAAVAGLSAGVLVAAKPGDAANEAHDSSGEGEQGSQAGKSAGVAALPPDEAPEYTDAAEENAWKREVSPLALDGPLASHVPGAAGVVTSSPGESGLLSETSLAGSPTPGPSWDDQVHELVDRAIAWVKTHPYHAAAGAALLYPAWLMIVASLGAVLREFTPVLIMSALVAVAATALSWLVLAGELPPLSAFLPIGGDPQGSSPATEGMDHGLVERVLGRAGPGKEQAGDVIMETEDGGEVRVTGPSTLDRAKDAAASLAGSAADAVARVGHGAVAAVTGAETPAGDVPEAGGTSVVGAIAAERDRAVADLKENVRAAAGDRGPDPPQSGYASDSEGPGPALEGVHHVR